MKKLIFSTLSVLFVSLYSCSNENISVTGDVPKEVQSVMMKSSSVSGNQTIYEVSPSILAYFQHYCQRYAGPPSSTYPNATSNITLDQSQRACGPTSYMMAAACLAGYKDPYTSYVVSGAKLAGIISKTGVSTYLTDLVSYANTYDNTFLLGVYNGPQKTDRTLSKQFIQTALSNNKFVIVAINARTYDYNTVNNSNLYYNTASNPDISSTGDVSSGSNKNYITTLSSNGSTVGGHIIVIVRMVVNNLDGTGIVEYVDPVAQTKPTGVSNRKFVSYTRLLNSMVANGSPNYDAISIALKGHFSNFLSIYGEEVF